VTTVEVDGKAGIGSESGCATGATATPSVIVDPAQAIYSGSNPVCAVGAESHVDSLGVAVALRGGTGSNARPVETGTRGTEPEAGPLETGICGTEPKAGALAAGTREAE
jgi:hypothetical protein